MISVQRRLGKWQDSKDIAIGSCPGGQWASEAASVVGSWVSLGLELSELVGLAPCRSRAQGSVGTPSGARLKPGHLGGLFLGQISQNGNSRRQGWVRTMSSAWHTKHLKKAIGSWGLTVDAR